MKRIFLVLFFLAFVPPLAGATPAYAAKKNEMGAAFRDGAEKDRPYIATEDPKPAKATKSRDADGAPIGGLLLILVAIVGYFFPWLMAKGRGHNNSLPIFWLTLLAGWTGIGWLAAFIWSLTSDVRPQQGRL